jgi:tRNA pseudouridine38-40 synthase
MRVMVTRYCAQVEYDGTEYFGFQRQANQPTVQGELERTIQQVTGQSVSITGAGRTDTGVHALGQVIAFDVEWRHGPDTLQRALNANLAADVALTALTVTYKEFHPRFDAKRRTYRYHIYNSPVRSPLHRRRSWHVSQLLDLESMQKAAKLVIGEHDFATFGQPPSGKNTVRQVFQADWRRREELLEFFIEANAFLYRMVRSLVGSMKAVGEGTWTLEEFATALTARNRGRAAQTAPAQALFLLSVEYE